jgi:hypothetical protein
MENRSEGLAFLYRLRLMAALLGGLHICAAVFSQSMSADGIAYLESSCSKMYFQSHPTCIISTRITVHELYI